MQLEKKYCNSTPPASAATSSGTTVAQQHASLFPTQLALARWTNGGDVPHIYASERPMPMRAAWYAQTQAHFQAWLHAGGFHRPEDHALDCALHAHPAELPFPVPGIGNWPAPDKD